MNNPVKESRKDKAYRTIQQNILTSKLKPGDFLSSRDLEKELGISKTPIREALIRLQEDGLLKIIPRKGIVIIGLPGRAIREMFEVRLVLESYAAEMACENDNQAFCESLKQILNKQKRAIEEDDNELFVSLDTEFHQTIVGFLGNDRINDMLTSVKTQLRQVGIKSLTIHTNMDLAIKQHIKILEALERNDPQGVKKAVREHLQKMRDIIVFI